MDYPPIGLEVCVTLADTTAILAYWNGDAWWQGVADNPNDKLVETKVISWNWRSD